ncbi:MAG: hypothetical protein ABI551_02285, partial [Polyangiaceae bacterium]
MKNLARAASIFSGVVAISGVAAVLVVGCGGDDTVIGYPGQDSGADVTAIDGGVDGSSDGSPQDSGPDAFRFDAGKPNLSDFYHQIDQVACKWLEHCCGGPTKLQVDGPNGCIDQFDNNAATFGFLATRPLQDDIDGGGHVTFDQTKANQCLAMIESFSCTVPLTSAQLIAFRETCYAAVEGTIPIGSTGCQESVECAPPGHCEGFDGGTCVAPYPVGSTCIGVGDLKNNANNCGRAFTGDPGNCANGGLGTLSDAGKCQAPLANG